MNARPILFSGPMVCALLCVAALAMAGCASNDPRAGIGAEAERNCLRVCGGTMRPGRSMISNEVRGFCLAVRRHAQDTGRAYPYANDARCSGAQ